MKNRIFVYLFLLFHLSSFCQKDTAVYAIADPMPEFAGGIAAMNNYFKEKIKYPEKEMQAGITGKVFLQFMLKPMEHLQTL